MMRPHSLRTFVSVCLLLALCACGSVPQPFRGAPQIMSDDPLLDIPTAVGIAVLPVRGVPAPLGTAISRAVAQRLQALEIPAEAVDSNAGLGFTLEGVANAAPPSPTGRNLVINWTLESRHGRPAGTHRQTLTVSEDTWAKGTGDGAALLGTDAGTAVAALLGADVTVASAPATPATPSVKLPTVSVKPVEGAPGDGREALRLAVLQVLSEHGLRRDDVAPDVTLTCQFTATPLGSDLQKVEIVWTAVNRDGANLGTMRLDNDIPTGALDGVWGPTAFAIAEAAMRDLVTLVTSSPPDAAPEH